MAKKLINTDIKLGLGTLLKEAVVDVLLDSINDLDEGYLRLESGLQICWGRIVGTTSGSAYLSARTAKPFLVNTEKIVISNPYGYSNRMYDANAYINDTQTDLIESYLYEGASQKPNTSTMINYIALGRWK